MVDRIDIRQPPSITPSKPVIREDDRKRRDQQQPPKPIRKHRSDNDDDEIPHIDEYV